MAALKLRGLWELGAKITKLFFFELLKKGWDQTFDFVSKESALTVDNSKSPKCRTFLIDTDLLLYCSYSLDYISLSLLFSLWLTLMSCLGSSECYSSFHSNANSSPIYLVVFLYHSTLWTECWSELLTVSSLSFFCFWRWKHLLCLSSCVSFLLASVSSGHSLATCSHT